MDEPTEDDLEDSEESEFDYQRSENEDFDFFDNEATSLSLYHSAQGNQVHPHMLNEVSNELQIVTF